MFLGMLLLASLACDFSFGDPAEIVAPAVETAEHAAQVAGQAAGTAAAQAGELAGTAVVMATTEGSEAIATVRAVATPNADYLKEKLASIEPDAEGNYQVALSEDEVNTLLRLRQLLTGDFIGAGIQSQQVTFRDGRITVSGSILEPLPGALLVRIRPTVEDGQWHLEIEEATVAGQQAPQQTLDGVERSISGALSEALAYLPAGVQLQEIMAADGMLTIVGSKTNGN
jgi:hypothetical protein